MTEKQLDLLIGYIQEKIQPLKVEIQDCDTYWSDIRAERILEELTKTITGETN